MNQPVKYYVSGHTANGYVNYVTSNIADSDKVIILQNGDYEKTTALFEQLIKEYEATYPEIMYIPQGAEVIGGVILQNGQLAILHESIVDETIENAHYINLTDFYEPPFHHQEGKHVEVLYEESYAYFKKGLNIHNHLERVYIQEMDFKKADDVAEEFIEKLLSHTKKKSKTSNVKKRM